MRLPRRVHVPGPRRARRGELGCLAVGFLVLLFLFVFSDCGMGVGGGRSYYDDDDDGISIRLGSRRRGRRLYGGGWRSGK